ncbi:IS607 family transposase [Bacillus sp. SN10]|uniref:IS607 family transposase n=1 Tax=Bacillus sp. SN10 TaxID=2056493 RepID=UPI000C32861E|nr:IS607 family transposase [Bacillus sp. SN10]PKJ52129.1 resolvase [Bacillus sp. SN10]
MKNYISIGKAANILGKTQQTLRNWDKEGVFIANRTPKGHRIYDLDKVVAFQKKSETHAKTETNDVFIYGRVSTKKQLESGNLDRQLQRLTTFAVEKEYRITGIYKGIASGLNENRKGFQTMLRDCKEKAPSVILIEYKDRLARFGFSYIESHLKDLGVNIYCIEHIEKNEEAELVEDLIAITTSFSAKIYGKRGGRKLENTIKSVLEKGEKDENNADL